MIVSNIVKKEKLREVQLETLKEISESLLPSFGPMGSNTEIVRLEGNGHPVVEYSKDGHTILQNIHFNDIIEESVRKDLEDITRHIVKGIGDGTTSAVLLSKIIFSKLKEIESDSTRTPYEIISDFKSAVKDITDHINMNKTEFRVEDVYNISMISTNGNEEVSKNLLDIYTTFGKDVFIDVAASTGQESILKSYDGMTLQTGYSDTAYVNNKKGTCSLRNPKIYAFDDPIDTPEMMSFVNRIIEENILAAFRDQNANLVPTVIIAPKISKDMSSYIEKIVEIMYKAELDAKPPLLIISDVHQREEYVDIYRLCGCKAIKKYIDLKQQDMDIKAGLAPSLDTITQFCGSAELVESDVSKTKFINPLKMFNELGEKSPEYNNLLKFLEAELKQAQDNNENINVIGGLKRRINSLKANMVDYFVGGVSMTDRDSLRDLVEDAVLNCRSAATYGVGYGANFEGLRSSNLLQSKSDMHKIIFEAYKELSNMLYCTCMSMGEASTAVSDSLNKYTSPINLKTKEFDGKVLSSMKSDVVVLEAISRIVTLMFTTNQFLCPNPSLNRYLTFK